MSSESKQQIYFDKVPKQWDALYSNENKYKYFINKWLRKGIFIRYKLTFEYCGDLTGARVLDIGCGTGRYSIESVKRGARRVVGIDFAPSMIEYSQNLAQEMGYADKCEFICDDFLTHEFNESFDVILALGVFEYIQDASPILQKIAAFRAGKFAATYPKFTPIWASIRYIRYYWIKKCPIYNYSEDQINRLYKDASFADPRILSNKRGYWVAAGIDSK